MSLNTSKNSDGQHTLEFIVLVTLIMAGIIIAGPYVIRSWNAQMKGWDDSVQDSLNDPLTTVPWAAIPGSACTPGALLPSGCGQGIATIAGTVSCTRTQQLTVAENLLTCADETAPLESLAKCEVDASCCIFNPDEDNTTPEPDPTAADCGANKPCFDNDGDGTPETPCPDGQYCQGVTCGDPTSPPDGTSFFTRCLLPGSNVCVFQCTGIKMTAPSSGYGNVCSGDEAGLGGNTPYRYVAPGGCTPGRKCEIECAPTWVPNGTGTGCVCPPGWNQGPTVCCPPSQTEVGGTGICQCAAGFVKACPDGGGGYIPGQCYQGTCPANSCEQ